jgi:hypothetical protein
MAGRIVRVNPISKRTVKNMVAEERRFDGIDGLEKSDCITINQLSEACERGGRLYGKSFAKFISTK